MTNSSAFNLILIKEYEKIKNKKNRHKLKRNADFFSFYFYCVILQSAINDVATVLGAGYEPKILESKTLTLLTELSSARESCNLHHNQM